MGVVDEFLVKIRSGRQPAAKAVWDCVDWSAVFFTEVVEHGWDNIYSMGTLLEGNTDRLLIDP